MPAWATRMPLRRHWGNALGPTREEAGCLSIHAFRSTRDPRLFSTFMHAGQVKEAFENHAMLLHTVRFIERVEPLIDHPLDVARVSLIG